MKKLVPATRSRTSRMQAGSSTEKAMRPITDVMNQAHVEKGMRMSDIPLVRRSSVVAMKLSDPRSWPTQKIAIESPQSVMPEPHARVRRRCRRR